MRTICWIATLITAMSMAEPTFADSVKFVPSFNDERPVLPPISITPSSPTVRSSIDFFTPLDGKEYGNSCFAGTIQIARDDEHREIFINHQLPPRGRPCILVYAPVRGAEGQFGPLAAGDWTLRDSHQNQLNFWVTEMPLDCNGDGMVDAEDLDCACASGNLQAVLDATGVEAGDLDADGQIDFGDFLVLSSNFGAAVENYSSGDINCDGTVDFSDFLIISVAFGDDSAAVEMAASVPEPRAAVLAIVSAVCCFLAARRPSAGGDE